MAVNGTTIEGGRVKDRRLHKGSDLLIAYLGLIARLVSCYHAAEQLIHA